MLKYQFFNSTNSFRIMPLLRRQANNVQPKFTFAVRCSHMDMWWFAAFVGIKLKPEGADFENCWQFKI